MATTKKTEAVKDTAANKPAATQKAAAADKESKVTENNAAAKAGTQPVKQAPTVAKRSAKKIAAEMDDPEVKIETALSRTEEYIHRNWKKMLTVLIIALLIVTAFLGYKYIHQAKRPQQAGAAMFAAEQMFKEDSFELALNGDGNNAGFLEVIDKYGSTPQGNIARHYAGVCYLQTGDMDKALSYLAQYKPTKGSPNQILNAQNKGLQGDIYVQKGDLNKAVTLYTEAIAASDNSFTAPVYLKKLGLVYDKLGKQADARATFQRIADDYATSMEARDAQKYIGVEEQK